MEMLLSVVLSELTTRSINYFLSRRYKPAAVVLEDRLQRALLQALVIIDDAMGRHITNQSLLQQLDMLRDTTHQAYYILDTFRFQSHHDKEATNDHAVSHSLSLHNKNSLKHFCSSNRKTEILEHLQHAFDSLSSMTLDVEKVVVFLTSYPHLYRQPYSMHLLLRKCMFGRQMETEIVLDFLLHTQPNDAEGLQVLPIVGPRKVGKSTLVAHVCYDERVCDHFLEIVFLSDHDFDEKLTYLGEACVEKYQNSRPNKDGRMLVVVEATGDFSEEEWKRLYATCKRCMKSGSKIIITSRSDKITKLGTTRTVKLKYLSDEAYWYFFKTLIFGSTDPMMHPRLVQLAMEISGMLSRCLYSANGTIWLLKDNFDINFWCKVLTFLRGSIKWHVSNFGEHPNDALNQNRPAHLGRMLRTCEEIMVHHQYECSSEEDVPKIALHSVIYGIVKLSGRFEALAFRSQIAPYYSYICTCEIRALKAERTKGSVLKYVIILFGCRNPQVLNKVQFYVMVSLVTTSNMANFTTSPFVNFK